LCDERDDDRDDEDRGLREEIHIFFRIIIGDIIPHILPGSCFFPKKGVKYVRS
jgi:hypothetical protein